MAQPQSSNQPLPSKEAALFRQVVKSYELKQYKKAVKAADQILKKFTDHGETLAMKGLSLHSMNKKEEAYDLARRGLKADLKSHVCWHVYGLLHRSDRNYREAIKAYLQALRLDKQNLQVLRDLALLQIQMRDISGFTETRYQLLQVRSDNRTNWLGFAVAHHLNGNYDLAVSILEAYDGTVDEIPQSEAYEHSELLLYKAMVLQEGGRHAEAITLLHNNRFRIKDQQSMIELKAQLLTALDRAPEAQVLYSQLLTSNPENYRIHQALQSCIGLPSTTDPTTPLTAAQRAALAAHYTQLAATYPRSGTCRRIPLDFLTGQDFTAHADLYVRSFLHKGIPSLFTALKPLYKDAEKAQLLGQLFSGYRAALESTGSLPAPLKAADEAQANGSAGSTGKEALLVWVLAYLGQHHSEMADTATALECLEAALKLEDIAELHTFKSKVLRRAGDTRGAVEEAEAARKLDLSDRFLNSLAVRALFDDGRVEDAEKTAAMFTRDSERQGAGLTEMQHMWYELHCGRAHMARGSWGAALKVLRSIGQHFEDMHEDQFDFHSYCLRKVTLRSYVQMLRMQDTLYRHTFYAKGSLVAVECWLVLHDSKERRKQEAEAQKAADAAAAANLTADELKKLKLKQKKEAKKRGEAAATAVAEGQAAAAAAGGSAGADKADAEAAKLEASEDPLGEAAKLVAMLKEHAADRVATHVASFEVASRRGRLLMALSAVQRALATGGADSAEAHRCAVLFCLQAAGQPEGVQEVVGRVVREGVEGILKGQSVEEFNKQWVTQHGGASLAHAAVGAEMQVAIKPGTKKDAVKAVMNAKLHPSKEGMRQAVAAHKMLLDKWQDAEAAAAFKDKCSKVFQWSGYFGGAKQTQAAASADGKQ